MRRSQSSDQNLYIPTRAAFVPSIRVSSVRQLFNDGNHNAFTEMCRFGDRLYLTFRNCPDGHMLFTTSRIIVLSSADGTD